MNYNCLAAFILGVCLSASVGYAQKTKGMMVGVSALSKSRAAAVLEARLARQLVVSPAYISSGELFTNVVVVNKEFAAWHTYVPVYARHFAALDTRAASAPHPLGYRGVLVEMLNTQEFTPTLFLNPHIQFVMSLLDIQFYMQNHAHHFPRVFEVSAQGELIPTSVGVDRSAKEAFLNVAAILSEQAKGGVNPVIVEQLLLLNAQAPNRVPVAVLETQLARWLTAHDNPPQLPQHAGVLSLDTPVEELWLAVEIRLLQLTPGLELPAGLQQARVVQDEPAK